MAPREDLIASAITFLQDPSVGAAPPEKRRAFLESKNLTNEEIEIAFARAGTPTAGGPPPSQQQGYPYPPPPQYSQAAPPPPPYGYGYPSYPGGPWAQQAMEPPKRDWRDWFIMATVTSGVGWGLYQIGKRYVMPLIKPPTPEQIEQDKNDISAQFDRAFTLIEQLASDTEALKTAESERNTKLDTALKDVEQVVTDLRTSNERREQENRRLADDVHSLQDSIPKALEGWKKERDERLQDLSQELRSLKTLMSNRLQPSSSSSRQQQQQQQTTQANPFDVSNLMPRANGTTNGQINDNVPSPSISPSQPALDTGNAMPGATATMTGAEAIAAAPPSKKPNRAAIPSWQMASANNASEGASGP